MTTILFSSSELLPSTHGQFFNSPDRIVDKKKNLKFTYKKRSFQNINCEQFILDLNKFNLD